MRILPKFMDIAVKAAFDLLLQEFVSLTGHGIKWSRALAIDDFITDVDGSMTCASIAISLETASLDFLSWLLSGTEALLGGVSGNISELLIRARDVSEDMLLNKWELHHLFKVEFRLPSNFLDSVLRERI